MLSTAMSVASFSVVLSETFAAVGLATLVPNGFVALARAAKVTGETALAVELEKALKATSPSAQTDDNPAERAIASVPTIAADLLKNLAKANDSIDLLVPKTARIEADFEFYGSEQYKGEAAAGGFIEMVQVKGGFSALYETHSSNKVKLTIDFATVGVSLT